MRVYPLLSKVLVAVALGVAVFLTWPPTPTVVTYVPSPLTSALTEPTVPCLDAVEQPPPVENVENVDDAVGGFTGDMTAMGTLAISLATPTTWLNVKGTLTLGGTVELDFDEAEAKEGTHLVARARAIIGKPARSLVWVGQHHGQHWVADLSTTATELLAHVRPARANEVKGLPRHEPWPVRHAREAAEERARVEVARKRLERLEKATSRAHWSTLASSTRPNATSSLSAKQRAAFEEASRKREASATAAHKPKLNFGPFSGTAERPRAPTR